MKIFISYSSQDKAFATKLAQSLSNDAFEVWYDKWDIKEGDNLFEKIEENIFEISYIIPILSKEFSRSNWIQKEVSAFAFKEIASDKETILPVLIEDCEIPIILQKKIYVDFRFSFAAGYKQLVSLLKKRKSARRRLLGKKSVIETKDSSLDFQVDKIKSQFQEGNLSLICGAGISTRAGIPAWSLLLKTLLTDLFTAHSIANDSPTIVNEKLAEIYQEHFKPTALMVAQYLKNGLGKDFVSHIREALYVNNPVTSPLIDSIVELCRPQRSKKSLHSIITFNFDNLIEQNLNKNSIPNKSIYKEGQRCKSIVLPIYHVHGYLPNSGRLTRDHQIVFSEDAYHSQFIDSFSWSNLIQLNHLSQNLCLFVGLSLTDPNLRRLLDVAMRKNPDRSLNHYIFKKKNSREDIGEIAQKLKLKAAAREYTEDLFTVAEMLEEQDANNLGLNVIWVNNFDEIPNILQRLL